MLKDILWIFQLERKVSAVRMKAGKATIIIIGIIIRPEHRGGLMMG
jgi:hypothetical protein